MSEWPEAITFYVKVENKITVFWFKIMIKQIDTKIQISKQKLCKKKKQKKEEHQNYAYLTEVVVIF